MELRKMIVVPLIALATSFGAAAAVVATPAMADEGIAPISTDDYTFAFWFDYHGDQKRTEIIEKEDASATYVYAESNSTTGTYLYVDSYSNSAGYINQTVGGYAYLGTRIGKFSIHQNVYENGYRWASLRGMGNSSGYVGGDWSADSWGTYTSLN